MKEFIISNLLQSTTVSFSAIIFKLLVALVIAGVIFITYYYSSPRVSYNGTFNLSLVAMAIITTSIMAVISSNIALSLGMVGALSIIRFRTAVKDPRDAMFIFWSIMVGICCGVAQYIIALSTTIVLAVFFLVIRAVKAEKRYVLIIRCGVDVSEDVKALTYRSFPNSRISVQNSTPMAVELIYELKHFDPTASDHYLAELYAMKDIECANFVLQEDVASV